MKQLVEALDDYAEVGPAGRVSDPECSHVLLRAAGEWAKWTAQHTVGKRFDLGMAIAKALADYASLDEDRDNLNTL